MKYILNIWERDNNQVIVEDFHRSTDEKAIKHAERVAREWREYEPEPTELVEWFLADETGREVAKHFEAIQSA